MRLALLAFLTFAFSLLGSAQGQLWNQRLDHTEVKVARGADGNIYAAGYAYVYASSLFVPIVACYNASGQLLYRVVSPGGFGGSEAHTSDLHIVGDELLFAIAFGQSTWLFRFSTATQTFTDFSLQSAGAGINVNALDVSSTTYCVVGLRTTDGNSVVQVRSLSTNVVLREVVTSNRLLQAFSIGSYYYVIGTASSPSRVVVHRVNSSSNSSYSVNAPNLVATGPLKGVAAGRILHLISNYDNLGAYNIYVVPFNTLINNFGSPWEEADLLNDSFVRTASSLGSTNLFLALQDRVLGISSTGSLLFETPYPDVSATVQAATSATDSAGNVACLVDRNGENTFYRYNPSGLVLNRHVVGLPKLVSGQMTLDAAGIARLAYTVDDEGFLTSCWLGAISQASLNLPGAYTVGGSSRTGTINIGGPAPAGGATFDLFSNNPAAVVPTTVTIPAGQTSVDFTITTTAVAANTKPTINARYSGIVLQNNFDLAAPLVQQVTATPQSQYGGVNIAGSVVLTGPAPTGGKTVTLTSSNTSKVTVPANVVVPAGATSANFVMTTFPTLVNASSVVTATTGAVSRTVFVAVVAPVFQNATLATNSIKGGQSTTMTLTIGTPAPSGYTITLASGATGFVQLPSSFAIPAGQTTANVPVSTSPVTSNTPVTLFAYRGPYIKTMTLNLTP